MKNIENTKYNWMVGWVSELSPGEAYRAEQGKEFDCLPTSFASVVYQAAKHKGWKATVVCFPDAVVFSFYRPTSFMRPNLAAYPIVKKLKGEV